MKVEEQKYNCMPISVDAIKNFEVEVGMNMIEVDGCAMAPRQLKLGSLDGAIRVAQAVFGCFSFYYGSICEGEENIWPDGPRQAETSAPVRVFAVVLDRRRARCEGTKKHAVTTIYQYKSMGHDNGSSSGNHENKTKFVLDCNLIGRKKKGKNGFD
ncbi:unnamed protein product [Lactuca saligna]|uniref:Uncharacterized protein n=1 Tax=Lactuca saligna TaxID=75948 RepID=A0AA35ZWQ0_LACSI|nr:unnamed protein product [Lactuca saligna]